MRLLLVGVLLLNAASAAAEWTVSKIPGAAGYEVYEDGQRRGTLEPAAASGYMVKDDHGAERAWADTGWGGQQLRIGSVRQDAGAATFGVFDEAGSRIGTLHPSR